MIASLETKRHHVGTWSLIGAAATVGVVVWLGARAFAAGSCPDHDVLAIGSSCRGLVASLAIRVGVVAAAAFLLMELVARGLFRTAEALEEERRARLNDDL